MSTPISQNPDSQNPSDELETDIEESIEASAIDEIESPTPERILEEVAPLEADDFASEEPIEETETPQEAPSRSSAGSGRLALVLTVLLLASLAVNFLQWRAQSRVTALADDYEIALTQAVEKLDEQTVRALSAEGTLSNVDTAMEAVRDRIAGLQNALDELAAAAGQ
jgi:hypothetical protein